MKLPRFQFHLSTLLFITLIAGVLIFINMRSRQIFEDKFNGHSYQLALRERYGWPFIYYEYESYHSMGGSSNAKTANENYLKTRARILEHLNEPASILGGVWTVGEKQSYALLCVDVAVAVAILFTAANLFENFIARQKRALQMENEKWKMENGKWTMDNGK